MTQTVESAASAAPPGVPLTSPMNDGRPDAPLLVLAQSPGREEMSQGRPLVGPAGRLLWQFAASAGWSRDQCYIVNTIGELPEGRSKVGRAEIITPRQSARWREQYYKLVGRSTAHTVLILGGPALEAATGLRSIESWRGYVVQPSGLRSEIVVKQPMPVYRKHDVRCKCVTTSVREEVGPRGGRRRVRSRTIDAECPICKGSGLAARAGEVARIVNRKVALPPAAATLAAARWILPTIHPSAVLMSGYALAPVLMSDLRRVGRALRGELRLASVAFDEAPTIFAGDGPLAVDIETDGGGEIVRVGMADEHRTWSIPWLGQDAVPALLGSGREIVIHNAGFDEPRLRRAGAPISGAIFDTMLATYMVQPDGRKGLNWAISLFLDAERHKHLADDRPALYNALDVRRTWDIRPPLERELTRTGQLAWFRESVMPAVRTLIGMSERGLRVDMQHLPVWRSELEQQASGLAAEWVRLEPTVNPASSAQVRELLGLDAADEDTLLSAKHRAEEAMAAGELDGATSRVQLAASLAVGMVRRIDTLLKLRAVSKLISTYADLEVGSDGCVHPSYLPGAKDEDDSVGKGIAYSGRWTARDPNIQQQPRTARRLFVPHTPGNVLLEADWNQMELRLIAALSGDAQLAADLDAAEHPVHGSGVAGQVAAAIGCTRKVAKVGLYLSAYLGSPRLLHAKFRAEGVQISYSECQQFQRRLFERYWRWAGWRREVVAQAQRTRELRNCFGKWAPFPGGARDAAKAANFHPQSVNASIATVVLPRLEAALTPLGASLLTLVHDSFLVEAPPLRASQAVEALREIMSAEWPQVGAGFRAPVNVKRGSNWAEMEVVA